MRAGKRKFFVALLLFPLLAGCSYEGRIDSFAAREESAFAMEYLENLRNRNFDEVKKHLDDEDLTPELDSQLTEISSYFPDGEPIKVDMFGFHVIRYPDRLQADLSYQYEFADGWAIVNIILEKDAERTLVTHVRVDRIPQSLEEIHNFTFSGKGIMHYLFLLFAGAVSVFIIFSLILCVKTPMERLKWLWIIFILFGFAGINLNWTTGQVGIKLLSVYLLGSGVFRAGTHAPWMITVSIPLGAILFLVRRKALTRPEESEEETYS